MVYSYELYRARDNVFLLFSNWFRLLTEVGIFCYHHSNFADVCWCNGMFLHSSRDLTRILFSDPFVLTKEITNLCQTDLLLHIRV